MICVRKELDKGFINELDVESHQSYLPLVKGERRKRGREEKKKRKGAERREEEGKVATHTRQRYVVRRENENKSPLLASTVTQLFFRTRVCALIHTHTLTHTHKHTRSLVQYAPLSSPFLALLHPSALLGSESVCECLGQSVMAKVAARAKDVVDVNEPKCCGEKERTEQNGSSNTKKKQERRSLFRGSKAKQAKEEAKHSIKKERRNSV